MKAESSWPRRGHSTSLGAHEP